MTVRVMTWNLWWRFGPFEQRLTAIVETIRRTGLIQILPIVTGLLFGILLHDSIEFGIRSRRRRRASLEAT